MKIDVVVCGVLNGALLGAVERNKNALYSDICTTELSKIVDCGLENFDISKLDGAVEVFALNDYERMRGTASVDERNVNLMADSRTTDGVIAKTESHVRNIPVAVDCFCEICYKPLVTG